MTLEALREEQFKCRRLQAKYVEFAQETGLR